MQSVSQPASHNAGLILCISIKVLHRHYNSQTHIMDLKIYHCLIRAPGRIDVNLAEILAIMYVTTSAIRIFLTLHIQLDGVCTCVCALMKRKTYSKFQFFSLNCLY